MAYTPTEWENGELLAANKFNKMEAGIRSANSSYVPTEWAPGDVITAEALNKIENGIAAAGGGGGDTPSLPYVKLSASASISVQMAKGWDGTIEYSTDGTTWATWNGASISGTEIYLRGTGNTKVTTGTSGGKMNITGSNVRIEGHLAGLLDYATVAAGQSPIVAQKAFYQLFYQCVSIIDAADLIFPSENLTNDYACQQAFYGCGNLVFAPQLPAKALGTSCYYEMFRGCSKLIIAPELPATTLGYGCYTGMFNTCTALAIPPHLPATTLSDSCYTNMFRNCTALKAAPKLPAANLTSSCYYYMFGSSNFIIKESPDSSCIYEYRIPSEGTGTEGTNSLSSMFASTSGVNSPSINTTYYSNLPSM